MSSEYKLLKKKELKNISIFVCSNRFTYMPHSCIIVSVPVRSCMPGSWMHRSRRGANCHLLVAADTSRSGQCNYCLSICPAVLQRLLDTCTAEMSLCALCRVQLAKHLEPHVPIKARDGPLLAAVAQRFCRSGEPPKSRIRVGFGFRVSGFGFRVSSIETHFRCRFRISLKPTFAVGFGFRVSGFVD